MCCFPGRSKPIFRFHSKNTVWIIVGEICVGLILVKRFIACPLLCHLMFSRALPFVLNGVYVNAKHKAVALQIIPKTFGSFIPVEESIMDWKKQIWSSEAETGINRIKLIKLSSACLQKYVTNVDTCPLLMKKCSFCKADKE